MQTHNSDRHIVLLQQVHELMRQHSETFWDMFSADETKKMKIFFRGLDPPDQHILEYAAMADAMLNAN